LIPIRKKLPIANNGQTPKEFFSRHLFDNVLPLRKSRKHRSKCCQILRPKIPICGKFWKVLQWKMLVFFMAILSILPPGGIFCDHLVHFVVIWYIFQFWYVVTRKIWQP
jgi:hypothetical protein